MNFDDCVHFCSHFATAATRVPRNLDVVFLDPVFVRNPWSSRPSTGTDFWSLRASRKEFGLNSYIKHRART